MNTFIESREGRAFIATADSRETSRDVMRAIAFLARNKQEAESIWNGDAIGTACTLLDIWEYATGNGAKDANMSWGASGEQWAESFRA